ncbi:MAG: Npt1/Npt2 family nucleotide transporter [Rhodothermales bacterium]
MKALETAYKKFFNIRRDEWPKALGLALLFFLVIATFWVLKPIKRGLIIAYFGQDALQILGYALNGAQAEQIGKVINMIVAYGVVIVFTLLARRLDRALLIAVLAGGFGVLFIVFSFQMAEPTALVVWTFYVMGDIFTTVMVVSFWAFANDMNEGSEAERLYGVVGLGGVVGGFAGATLVSTLVEPLGRAALLYVCTGLVAALVVVAYAVDIYVRGDADRRPASSSGTAEAPVEKTSAVWEGARVVLKSRYLLAIMALVGLYEIVSNVADFQLATFVELHVPGDTEKDAFFGFVGQLTGIVSIGVQLLVTTYVLQKYGTGVALFFLPIAILVGSAGFMIVPTLVLITFVSVSDNGLNYSINQSARETLYTPLSQDGKYKAKAFIDMFVQRAAKVLAVGVNLGLTVLVSTQVRWLSLLSVVLISAWLWIIYYLGREFSKKKESSLIDQLAVSGSAP